MDRWSKLFFEEQRSWYWSRLVNSGCEAMMGAQVYNSSRTYKVDISRQWIHCKDFWFRTISPYTYIVISRKKATSVLAMQGYKHIWRPLYYYTDLWIEMITWSSLQALAEVFTGNSIWMFSPGFVYLSLSTYNIFPWCGIYESIRDLFISLDVIILYH
jgi:hypothetical protein